MKDDVRSEIFAVQTVECRACSVECEVYVCGAKDRSVM